MACDTRSSGSRLIFDSELEPSSLKPSWPVTSSATVMRRTSAMPKCASNKRMNGPIAQDALLSLALPSSRSAAAFEVAQVDVVAERRAQRLAAAVHGEHDLRARGCSESDSA